MLSRDGAVWLRGGALWSREGAGQSQLQPHCQPTDEVSSNNDESNGGGQNEVSTVTRSRRDGSCMILTRSRRGGPLGLKIGAGTCVISTGDGDDRFGRRQEYLSRRGPGVDDRPDDREDEFDHDFVLTVVGGRIRPHDVGQHPAAYVVMANSSSKDREEFVWTNSSKDFRRATRCS